MKARNATIFKGEWHSTIFWLLLVTFVNLPAMALASGLGEILHQVEQNAPLLQAESARTEASEAGVRLAKSRYWGHAELFARSSHYDDDRLVNPISYPPVLTRSLFDNNTYGYGVAFTLPLDIDGRINADVSAKRHFAEAAMQNEAHTRLSLFALTVNLYRGLQRQDGVGQALQKQFEALKEHQRITEASVQVGRVASVELLRIKAETKSVEGELAAIAGDKARIRAQLAALLNTDYYTEPAEPLGGVPSERPSLQQATATIENRPDVHAARSIIKAEDENLKGAKREWLPNLTLHAEASHNEGYSADGQNIWSITALASWQFLDGGRRHATTDIARANQLEAQLRYLSTMNNARAQLHSASAAWKAAELQYQAASLGIEAARENERIQSDRFVSGRISAVDLIDAEASLASSRSDFTSALAGWWLADDLLHLAMGEVPSAY